MKYKIIEHCSRDEFEKKVNSYLNEGWKLQGGVSASFNDGGSIKGYLQAITLEEIKKK